MAVETLLEYVPATVLARAVKISVRELEAGIAAGPNVQTTAPPAPGVGDPAGTPIVPAADVL